MSDNSGVNFAGWMVGLLLLAVVLLPVLCFAGLVLMAIMGSAQ